MASLPERAGRIAATGAEIARLQTASVEATVLEKAKASLIETGYDNWNGRTTCFTLWQPGFFRLFITHVAASKDERSTS